MSGLKRVRTCVGLALLVALVPQLPAQSSHDHLSGVDAPTLSAPLLVQSPPVITVQPSPRTKTVSAGATVVYSVTATGAQTYQWKKRPLVPFAPFVNVPGATGPTLTLSPVKGTDAGAYKCKVTNASGSVMTRMVQLAVL